MARTPMIRQTSILGSIPNLSVLALFIIVAMYFSRANGPLVGACSFLALRYLLRAIPRGHRAAIGMVRRQQFGDAIPHFLRSFEFFDHHRWLDDHRAFFLLAPSFVCYREMALANAGFCYLRIGDGANARKYYSQCVNLFPGSMLVSTALQMFNAGASDVQQFTQFFEQGRFAETFPVWQHVLLLVRFSAVRTYLLWCGAMS